MSAMGQLYEEGLWGKIHSEGFSLYEQAIQLSFIERKYCNIVGLEVHGDTKLS